MMQWRSIFKKMAFGAGCSLLCLAQFSGLAWAQEPSANTATTNATSATVDAEALLDVPINVAFYKPSVYYPPLSLRRLLPKAHHTALGWTICAVILFVVLTWPVNTVELVFWERNKRQRRKQERSLVPVYTDEAKADNDVNLITRQVAPSAEDAPVTAWEADSVPLLERLRRLDDLETSTADSVGESATAPPPRNNPLQFLLWNKVKGQFHLPLTDSSVGAGLHIIKCAQSVEETLNDVIIDLLRTTSGSIIIVSANFNETKLVNDIVGAQEVSRAEQLALIRRNASVLNDFLKRLAFTPGQRLFAEEFLRLVTELGRKRGGIAAVLMDLTARAEVGAYPHKLSEKSWCEMLHGIATHGAFPIFLLTMPTELATEPSYSHYTEVE